MDNLTTLDAINLGIQAKKLFGMYRDMPIEKVVYVPSDCISYRVLIVEQLPAGLITEGGVYDRLFFDTPKTEDITLHRVTPEYCIGYISRSHTLLIQKLQEK